jgi:hypothetical protein
MLQRGEARWIRHFADAIMANGDKGERGLGAAVVAPPEALVVCPECRVSLRPSLFETHLRQVHRIYQFRGVRRSFNDTFATLLDALVVDRPDAEAWHMLSALANEDHGARADVFLARTLGQLLTRIAPERRAVTIDALGVIVGRTAASSLALTLASDAELLARHLALIVMAHLPPPLDAALIPPLRGLLLDRRLPMEAQFAALANVLRSASVSESLIEELLQTLVSGLGKTKSIDRLRRLEQVAGSHPAIETLCEQLEDRLRMNCPRCPTQLRRPEMIAHLWHEHRLVLDGRRVRDPWSMIEEWIEGYRERRDPDLLDRCRILVQRLDTDETTKRFHRLLLTQGVADEEARRALAEEAAARHAACCPWCYELVPVPPETPPARLNLYRGRLSAGGYRVEVSERGLRTFLDIVTPEKRIYQGRELGQLWTRRGAMIVFVGPLVFVALLWAFGIIRFGVKPLAPVSILLVLALAVHLLTRWHWRPRLPAAVRARNYAWTMLVPRLFADGYRIEDSSFVAGLALLSCGDGYAPLRESLLVDLVKRIENALAMGLAPPGHLAALRRLLVEDAVARGAEPVPLVVDLLARCFEGRLSLRFAEDLLAGWQSPWWTPGNRIRVRVLLCDRAFEAGFEVRNLLDAGQSAPVLGRLLGTDDVANLAALRLLWSLRPTRPWDRCGDPLTVFDLAADPQQAELLGRIPDLLLWQIEPEWRVAAPGVTEPKPALISFCVRGVLLQEVLFRETPRVVEVNARWRYNDLVLGEHRFRSTGALDMLALRMERWFRYAFSDFLPMLPNVEKWQAPDRLAILRAWGAVACPSCQRQLLPHVGQIWIALSDEDKETGRTIPPSPTPG